MVEISDEYEKLVRDLHESLVKADGVENIRIEHNVKIKGKSGAKHQIDVYWEFKLAGTIYKTCIECKHYSDVVKKQHIASFATILEDIGNATGIFATTMGYQSGAKLLAKQKGIRLILVNYLAKEIEIDLKFIIPNVRVTKLNFDPQHVRNILKLRGIEKYECKLLWSGSDFLYDENGIPQITLSEIMKDKIAMQGENTLELDNLYLETEIGFLQVNSIDYTVTHGEFHQKQSIKLSESAKAIMKDVFENISFYYHDDGSVTQIEKEQTQTAI